MKKNQSITRQDIFILFIVGLLGLLIFNQYMFRYRDTLPRLIELAQGIPNGITPWIAFQNRLLAPTIVNAFSQILGSEMRGILFFYLITLLLQNFIIYFLLKIQTKSNLIALSGVVIFCLLLLGYQDTDFYYPWDPIEGILFTFFSYFALVNTNQRQTLALTILFIVACLNRESSLYIAIFICLLGIEFNKSAPFIHVISFKKIAAGFVLLGLGVFYTKTIRTLLFVRQPDGAADIANQSLGNHFYLISNLKDLFYNNFTLNLSSQMGLTNTIWIIGSSIFVMNITWKQTVNFNIFFRLLLIYFLMIFAAIMFGQINETRIYFPIFIVFIFMTCTYFIKK